MKRNNPVFSGKIVVGVSGTIASGKSTLCRFWKERAQSDHAAASMHIDADLVARDVVQDLHQELAEVLGDRILGENGIIDRKVLGSIVFSDEEKLKQLNAMVHPATCEKIRCMIEASSADFVIIEAIELFRSALRDMIDYAVVVYAMPELRIERMMNVRGLSREEAASRVRSQLDDGAYLAQADYVIHSTDRPVECMLQESLKVLNAIMEGNAIS